MTEITEAPELPDLLFAGVDNPDQYIWEGEHANRDFTVQHCYAKLSNNWSIGWKTKFPAFRHILAAATSKTPPPQDSHEFYIWAGYLKPATPEGASGVYEGIEGYEYDGYVVYFDTFAPALAYALTLTETHAAVPNAVATEGGWVYPDQIQDIRVQVTKGDSDSYAYQLASNFQPAVILGPRTPPKGLEAEELRLAFVLKDGRQLFLHEYQTVTSVKIVDAEILATPIAVSGRKKALIIDLARVQKTRQTSYHRIRAEAESLCQKLAEKFNVQFSLESVDKICQPELVA